jgi:hypothetical protein
MAQGTHTLLCHIISDILDTHSFGGVLHVCVCVCVAVPITMWSQWRVGAGIGRAPGECCGKRCCPILAVRSIMSASFVDRSLSARYVLRWDRMGWDGM